MPLTTDRFTPGHVLQVAIPGWPRSARVSSYPSCPACGDRPGPGPAALAAEEQFRRCPTPAPQQGSIDRLDAGLPRSWGGLKGLPGPPGTHVRIGEQGAVSHAKVTCRPVVADQTPQLACVQTSPPRPGLHLAEGLDQPRAANLVLGRPGRPAVRGILSGGAVLWSASFTDPLVDREATMSARDRQHPH